VFAAVNLEQRCSSTYLFSVHGKFVSRGGKNNPVLGEGLRKGQIGMLYLAQLKVPSQRQAGFSTLGI
jgi:hypothetical protein